MSRSLWSITVKLIVILCLQKRASELPPIATNVNVICKSVRLYYWFYLIYCYSMPMDFTDNHNRFWRKLCCGNPVRFYAVVHYFVRNYHNLTLRRPFIDNREVIYWSTKFVSEYQYQTRNQQVLSVVDIANTKSTYWVQNIPETLGWVFSQ